MEQLELIPAEEAEQIQSIIDSTMKQMQRRYPEGQTVKRGVHPKDHGCVSATFKVDGNLPEGLRVGVFKTPGQEFGAWIRFSNAAPRIEIDDSPLQAGPTPIPPRIHGSRGMALKLMGVSGDPLLEPSGPLTQDFLMVNHPVFPFANVEDYEVLSTILANKDNKNDDAKAFFRRLKFEADGKTPDMIDPVSRRAWITRRIIGRIQSPGEPPLSYQHPPKSPVDNRYFSGSPFLFGQDRVMKFSATPESPEAGNPADLEDPVYLRKALHERLTAPGAMSIHFQFQVQLRSVEEVSTKIEDIENASSEWDQTAHPFLTVARITIPPQDFLTEERRDFGESLVFSPWHGVAEHRPLGGINRLRRAVYEASAAMRHVPKEPAHTR